MNIETEQHIDDIAIDKFAVAMKARLKECRESGLGGWNDPQKTSVAKLKILFTHSYRKYSTNWVDVGNYAMMIWNREKND